MLGVMTTFMMLSIGATFGPIKQSEVYFSHIIERKILSFLI